jgi:DNA-binding GntR family transcriptional regulator
VVYGDHVEDRPVLDAASAEPLYMQVADYIEGQVKAGKIARGQRLPSERDMGEYYGVAYQTVRRAMRELRGRGLVESVLGKGTFITKKK